MNRIYKISLFSLLFALSAVANIVEHSEFASIFNYLTPDDYHKNTVVILDIDNTIATLGSPFQLLGSDAWYAYELNKRIESGLTLQEAKAQLLPLYFELVHIIDLRPVEPTTVQIIKQLQALGITVIACTIRSTPIVERTIIQLQAIDIDLTNSGFSADLECPHTPFKYKNGIIFCHGGDKGAILQKVLDHFNHTPTKVIFIDDKEKYLHQIKQILHPDIEFIGIRYSHLDEKVASFDHILADQELQAYLKAI